MLILYEIYMYIYFCEVLIIYILIIFEGLGVFMDENRVIVMVYI